MLIYGWKTYAQVLAVLTLVCKQCAMPAEHVVRRLTTKFTLFFIPLFPVGRKHTLTCSACEAAIKIPREQAEQLAMGGGGQPVQTPAPFTGPPQPQPQYGLPPRALQGPPPMPAPPMPGPAMQGPPQPQYGLPPMQHPAQPQLQRGPAPMPMPMGPPYQPPPPQPVPNGGFPPHQQGGYPPAPPPGYPYPPGR